MPALFTRYPAPPMAFSASGTRASTEARSERFAVTTCVRLAELREPRASKPLAARAGKANGRALRMQGLGDGRTDAAEAPVTRANLRKDQTLDVSCQPKRPNVNPPSEARRLAASDGALRKARKHLARATFYEAGDTFRTKEKHGFTPAHRAGDLLDEMAADGLGVSHGGREHIRHHRYLGA